MRDRRIGPIKIMHDTGHRAQHFEISADKYTVTYKQLKLYVAIDMSATRVSFHGRNLRRRSGLSVNWQHNLDWGSDKHKRRRKRFEKRNAEIVRHRNKVIANRRTTNTRTV